MHSSTFILFCAAALPAAVQNTSPSLERHIEAAQQAQSQQDCHTAAQEYGAAVKLMPSNAELHANHGIALYCDQRYPEAVAALRASLQRKPALSVPHLFLGLSAYRTGDVPTAERELRKSVNLMPNDPTAPLFLGYLYLDRHQAADALPLLESAHRLQPTNAEAAYALAEAHMALGRQSVRELQNVAPAGRALQQLAAEQTSLRMQAGVSSTTPQLQLSGAEQQLYNQAHEAELRAAELFQQVVDTAPSSPQTHIILGDEASAQRQNTEAVNQYKQALTRDPSLPGIRLAMANCLMQLDDSAGALAVLKEEQSRHPESAEVATAMGRVQLSQGDTAGALASLHKATGMPAAPPAAFLLLGRALLRTGDSHGATAALEGALARGAEPSTTNYLLSRAYRAMGDRAASNKALNAFHQASLDENERRAASRFIDPREVPQTLNKEDQQEASPDAQTMQ